MTSLPHEPDHMNLKAHVFVTNTVTVSPADNDASDTRRLMVRTIRAGRPNGRVDLLSLTNGGPYTTENRFHLQIYYDI